ncbi:MAG TPA: metallophosphoesterase [Gemmatimonadaceae bacterium]|nr:metallophosphoesterase [Gemmatimonadaceae bacterium]
MADSRPRRRSRGVFAIALRVVTYFVLAWGVVAVLASSAFAGGAWVTALVATYFTIPLIVFIRWRGWPFYPNAWFRLLVVRPFWYAQLVLPLVAAAGLLGLVVGWPFGHALLIGRTLASVVAIVVAAILVAGYLGSRRLVVRHVDVDVPGLPESFDGLRIAQLSDLHIGPHTSKRFINRVVAATRALTPDLVAVTGDLIDDRAEDVAVYASTIGALDAPLGVYMIPGNHDVYAGWDDVEHALRVAGIGTVLVNEARSIHRGGDAITLVGTGDPAGGRRGTARVAPDIDRAMSHVASDAIVIAFAHNPALWPPLVERGVALTLSGHTHWGQFAMPRLGWSLASPFLEHAMGAHHDDTSVLYISPGTGYWGIPFRLGALPEVTLVTLRRADRAAARVHKPRAA